MRGVSNAEIVSDIGVFRVRASSGIALGPLYWVRRAFFGPVDQLPKETSQKVGRGPALKRCSQVVPRPGLRGIALSVVGAIRYVDARSSTPALTPVPASGALEHSLFGAWTTGHFWAGRVVPANRHMAFQSRSQTLADMAWMTGSQRAQIHLGKGRTRNTKHGQAKQGACLTLPCSCLVQRQRCKPLKQQV